MGMQLFTFGLIIWLLADEVVMRVAVILLLKDDALPYLILLNVNSNSIQESVNVYHMCVSRISLIIWLARVSAYGQNKNSLRKISVINNINFVTNAYLEHISCFLSTHSDVIGFIQEGIGIFRFV